MKSHELLIQCKAELDLKIDGFLRNLGEDEAQFRQRITNAHVAAAYYREALLAAAKDVSAEKGEAYQETADRAVPSVTDFIGFLSEHRRRQTPES